MSSQSQTYFFAGGGTGGHLYPGIAVASALVRKQPDAKCVFLCTQREIDRTILSATPFEFVPQPIVPPVRTVNGLLKFWTHWRETKDLNRKLRREHRPVAVLGLGGYAAGVAVRYLASRKIPAAILNPDVIPGRANHFLMRYVRAVCCQFEETVHHLPANQRSKVKITGCPVRPELLTPPTREEAAARLGLDPLLNTLVITGASQGAATLNDAAVNLLSSVSLQGWQILHLTGKEHAAQVRAQYRENSIPALVIDFTPAMADVWAVANLAVCRSGASTVAELAVCGVPSILFPYPFHKDMHQRANAKVLADGGAAVIIDDVKDAAKNAAALKPVIEPLLYDANRRHAMSTAARILGRRDAADAVAETMMQMAGVGR
ncbi:MAG: UDP-N-acetylglucosamine--N-acetylmuramyl-(pentapeptide) pyrophosphoryl-undecaprenol N-acetylglucosamine transferase [Phycisphaerae bacterium]|nr:UDP-N-acetylglucosamine--N-acetylmuramyl-(pentapeptide) pyrophosphoryl-undecaprenol N-acetylglucosamine transferase [Phycisphaerae bacterium]